ncbi:MAG TPA: extracellular solute-binding protein [Candidatus Acidoferrales bacterium]|nr:extracellular solute-binding protein [Candidatus Acidoferrales bacterium]
MFAEHFTAASGKKQKSLPLAFFYCGLAVLGVTGVSGATSWDETVAAARQEGKLVVVLGGAASRNYRPIFRLFEDKFGVRTVVSTGGGTNQADRILAERGAGKHEVDIIMTGGTTANTRLVPNGVLDPVGPVLFHPEVVNKSLWYKGKHHYSDPEEKYVFAFSGTADLTPVVMRFNTKKLPVEAAKKIDSVWGFLDKRFAGEIVALPPTIGGAGGTYFTVQVHPDIGEKYLRRFFDPELNVTFTEDYRQIADGVARGKYTMAIFVGSAGRDIDKLGRQGLPVASFTDILDRPLKERPTLQGTGASNNIAVVNRRPHPNATKLFINWFLSKEGQTAVHTKSEQTPDQTFRIDVTEVGKLNPAEMRKPGVDYLMLEHDPEVQKKRITLMKRAEELYRETRVR